MIPSNLPSFAFLGKFCKKDTHFGEVFRSAAYPMGKGELSTVISAYRKQCEVLGVTFKMGKEVSEEARPDTIVVATGSVPLTPPKCVSLS